MTKVQREAVFPLVGINKNLTSDYIPPPHHFSNLSFQPTKSAKPHQPISHAQQHPPTDTMHPSSTIHTILRTYTLLALALALTSSASLFPPSSLAPSTLPPPASASLKPRGGDLVQALPGACGSFDRYVVAPAGTSCERLASDNGITMDELLLMNPDINAGCSNLIAGNSYCVGQLAAIPTPAPAPAAQPTTHSVVVVHKTVTVAPSPIVSVLSVLVAFSACFSRSSSIPVLFDANNVLTSWVCTAGLEQRVHGHPIDLPQWGYRHRQRCLYDGLLQWVRTGRELRSRRPS